MTGPRSFRPVALTWAAMPPSLRLSFVRGLDDTCEARLRALRQTHREPGRRAVVSPSAAPARSAPGPT